MNSARLAVQRTAPVGIPTTPAGRALNTFRARRRQTLTAALGLGNAAEALGLTVHAIAKPGELDPTGRLAELQAALAADNPAQAGNLLDAMLTAYLDEVRSAPEDELDEPGGTAGKPKLYRKKMSRMAWLIVYMQIG